MAERALMMLEALDSLYPISTEHKDFLKRIINSAYQEGKLAGFRQFMGDKNNDYEQDNAFRHN